MVGREGEMAGAVPFFEPSFEVESSGIALQLKSNIRTAGHRLVAR